MDTESDHERPRCGDLLTRPGIVEGHMRVERAEPGSLVISGTADEWKQVAGGLDTTSGELNVAVRSAAERPGLTSITVGPAEALAIIEGVDNEELTQEAFLLLSVPRMAG